MLIKKSRVCSGQAYKVSYPARRILSRWQTFMRHQPSKALKKLRSVKRTRGLEPLTFTLGR